MTTPLSILLSMPLLLPVLATRLDEAPVPRTATTHAMALPLSSVERTDLAAAEQASMHELLDVRGGELTNDNLWTILLVLGIVVLVLILI